MATWSPTAGCDPVVFAMRFSHELHPSDIGVLLRFVSRNERETWARIADPRRRDRYLLSHALLHVVLAHIKGIGAPVEISFDPVSGRPRPASTGRSPHLHFNLSRCAGGCLVAVSSRAVGVDIEDVAPYPHRIAERFFSSEERASIEDRDESARPTAFFHHWVVKEACAKSVGADAFPFWRIPSTLGSRGRTGDILWHRLEIDRSVAAAVAVRAPMERELRVSTVVEVDRDSLLKGVIGHRIASGRTPRSG